ncbi:MAG: DPP IV N-terminal domain-containing protein [Longimicrobiales bacterium]
MLSVHTSHGLPDRPAVRALTLSATCLCLLWSPSSGAAQSGEQRPDAIANFDLAARWAPYKMREMVHSTTVEPRWIEGSEKFWYEWENGDGTFFYIVDPEQGSRNQLFDNDVMAAELTRITRDPWDGQHLPITNIRFIDDDTFQFDVESSQDEEVEAETDEDEEQQQEGERDRPRTQKRMHHFEFTVSTQALRELEDYEEPDDHPAWASVSPDGQTVVFARNYNLWMMSGSDYAQILDARRGKDGDEAEEAENEVDVEEIQLTSDGEEYYSYEANGTGRGETNISREENMDDRKRASLTWSQDSRRFALVRTDYREVGKLWVVHTTGNNRPELETYAYEMPGEDHVDQHEIVVYDVQNRSQLTVADERETDPDLSIVNAEQFFYQDSDEPRTQQWVSENSDELYYLRISRDRHRASLSVANTATGEFRDLFVDSLNTYMETRQPHRLEDGSWLWWSEQDGWAHIYRYAADGSLRNRVTSGPWHVDGIVGVDEQRGYVFLTGQGRESGEDPYYQHLYRVNLDGSGLTLLNPGDYDHRFAMGESRRFFVDSYARVNTTPASALFNAQGTKILDLEVADFSALEDAGYAFPEPFVAEAADGVTDIYGVMYKPYDFDPEKSYPIVAYVYPGPQTESVSKFWSTNPYEQGLAQFGVIVVTLGNRGGNPDRSKWYHNYGYGDLRDYGLADKKAVIEQLGDRHDFIDLDRIGIYGHSGGGFMSTAAMLVYPDFFKVAVSSSGNHNNDVYNRWWSETHHGVKEVVDDEGNVSFEYDIEKNSDLAANLKGHLLLTTGNIDNNVHHAGTHRMAEALIRANKRFDYFVFPGQRHGYGNMGDYWFWLRAEYFVEHLLGATVDMADIIPLQVEQPKTR